MTFQVLKTSRLMICSFSFTSWVRGCLFSVHIPSFSSLIETHGPNQSEYRLQSDRLLTNDILLSTTYTRCSNNKPLVESPGSDLFGMSFPTTRKVGLLLHESSWSVRVWCMHRKLESLLLCKLKLKCKKSTTGFLLQLIGTHLTQEHVLNQTSSWLPRLVI